MKTEEEIIAEIRAAGLIPMRNRSGEWCARRPDAPPVWGPYINPSMATPVPNPVRDAKQLENYRMIGAKNP